MRHFLTTFIFIFLQPYIFSQNEKIKIKKEDYSLYFFQKGNKTDTISKTKGDLFYLKAGLSRRSDLLIEIENGKLLPLINDTIMQLVLMPGMNYRHRFSTNSSSNMISEKNKSADKPLPFSVFKTEVNGASVNQNPSQITIRFTNLRGDSILLKNIFFYR
jgi:hypothetical protein